MKKLILFFSLFTLAAISYGQGNWTLSGAKNRWANGMGFGNKDTSTYTNASDTNLLVLQYPGVLVYRHLLSDHWEILSYNSTVSNYKLISDSLFNAGYTRRDRTKQGLDSLGALKLNISDTPHVIINQNGSNLSPQPAKAWLTDSLIVSGGTGYIFGSKISANQFGEASAGIAAKGQWRFSNNEGIYGTNAAGSVFSRMLYQDNTDTIRIGNTTTPTVLNANQVNIGNANRQLFQNKSGTIALTGDTTGFGTTFIKNQYGQTVAINMFEKLGVDSAKANVFIGALNGNASTATLLQTARNINGVSFNGSADITVTAAAGTLTGSTLNSSVTGSSLTSVGTIGTGVWQGTAIADSYISSASTWNAKQSQLNGTGFVKASGTSISYDNTPYMPTSGGDFTGSITIPNAYEHYYAKNSSGSAVNMMYMAFNNSIVIGSNGYNIYAKDDFIIDSSLVVGGTITGAGTGLTGTASGLSIGGNAANITATSNSTITTLSSLSLPYSQLTGTPSLSGYVPYTGATTDVNLGSNSLTAGAISGSTGTFSGDITGSAFLTLNGYSGYGAGSGSIYYNGTLGNFVTSSGFTAGAISGTTGTFSGDISNSQVTLSNTYPNIVFTSVGNIVTTGANYIAFRPNDIEKVRITSGGNVLIGTATDDGANKLQVNGGITGTTGTFSQSVNISTGYNLNFNGGSDAFLYADASGGGRININGTNQLQLSTAGTTALTINSSQAATFAGPAVILLNGNAAHNYVYINRATNAWDANIISQTGGVNKWILGQRGDNTDNFYLYGYGAGTSVLSFTYATGAATFASSVTASSLIKSGGTSSQFLKADGSVDGNTYLTSAVTSLTGTTNQVTVSASTGAVTVSLPSAVTISGNMTAAGFFESSDKRLKNYTYQNTSLDGLRTVSFFWKPELNRDNKQHWGYLAQDVEKILPDQVNIGADGYKTVNYIEVLVYKIAQLEKRITQLENKNK